MPNTCCCVPGCSNRKGGHIFPVDKERRKAWALALKREDGKNKGKAWIPGQHHVVCKEHFLPSDYTESVTFPGWLNKIFIL